LFIASPKLIAGIHAPRFDAEKIILGPNKALEAKVEMLTARLAEIAPGPDGNLSLIIHGPRKTPLPEQQHDAAQESPEPARDSQDAAHEPPEPAPAPESRDAGAPFPPGADRFGNPHGSDAWLAAAFDEQKEVAVAFAEQQEDAEQSAEQQESPPPAVEP
jgi:hypothetical protein